MLFRSTFLLSILAFVSCGLSQANDLSGQLGVRADGTDSIAERVRAAVMENRERLQGTFGPDDDWPTADLTLEDDRRALSNHEREHRLRAAFTYTVMDPDRTEVLGCVYILPLHGEDYDAQAVFWAVEKVSELEPELEEAIRNWLRTEWPFGSVLFPGRDMDWSTYNRRYG